MTELQTLLSQEFKPEQLSVQAELAPLSYFKIGGPAELLLRLEDVRDIQKLLRLRKTAGFPLTVIGGGSNVLISDAGIAGVVLMVTHAELTLQQLETGIDGKQQLLSAGAGCKMSSLVRFALDQSLAGLEYFLGVPGTVGGAIYNNAHYLDDLISEAVESVTAIDSEGKIKEYSAADCSFAYEKSRFQQSGEIIYEAQFLLKEGDLTASKARVAEATRYRAKTQPLGEPSSGCVFQNPQNTQALKERFPAFADRAFIPAGFLIDQAGLKGLSEGPIEVSHKHAAFLVNKGAGKAAEVKKLIQKVQQRVFEEFGVQLKEEIFYLGD